MNFKTLVILSVGMFSVLVGLALVSNAKDAAEPTEIGYTINNQPGMKIDTVQCLNMITGKIEICVR